MQLGDALVQVQDEMMMLLHFLELFTITIYLQLDIAHLVSDDFDWLCLSCSG